MDIRVASVIRADLQLDRADGVVGREIERLLAVFGVARQKNSVAALVGISDSYLRRGFRAAYGEGALDYLLRLRIRHAKNLLQSEFYTVSEIALRCGFHSSTYFIQCFRAHTGETPNAYRMRHRGI